MESSTMLPIELIVVLVLMLTEAAKAGLKRLFKVDSLSPVVVPLTAVFLGALLNLLNAVLFGPALSVEVLRVAASQGILAAAAAAGVWSAGVNYVEQRNKQANNQRQM